MSQPTHNSTPKVGVFVCHCGGNISDVIEVDKVTAALKDYPGVTLATHYEFMCSDPGQNQIKDAIKDGTINRVVVAACSPRLHALTFRRALESAGLNPYFLEQANIREQASWVHKMDPAGATQKAIRLIKGAVDKVKLAKPLDKIQRKAVYRPYETARPNTPAIDWHNCTRCGQCPTLLGDRVDLTATVTDHHIETGILLIATGYEHYEPAPGEYGYGQLQQVITLPALIRLLDEQGPFQGLPQFNGKPIKDIGFIHCVGSRQLEGVTRASDERPLNKHCSRVCCTATLHMANELRDKYPDLHLYDFYQDIRTYGRDHEVKYYQAASSNRVLFFRYDPRKPPVVSDAGQGKLKITVEDLLTMHESLEVELDLLVLATGMVPADVGALADRFKLPRSTDGDYKIYALKEVDNA